MTDADTAATVPATTVPAADRARLDADIAALEVGARSWSLLTLGQRRTVLRRIRAAVGAVAQEWAQTAATSKGLDPESPLRGEEWLAGPYGALTALDAYIDTLTTLAAGGSALDRVELGTAPGDRVTVHTSPLTAMDALLLSGYSTEVWLRPGVTAADARARAGLGQRTPLDSGGVGLVLGAGNVSSIPFLDVLYELLASNRTVILKVNPTQDDLVPVFARALAPLIEPGFLRIVRGGGDVGAYLTTHPGIGHVHITGAARTFDTIVWGPSGTPEQRAEVARRKAADDPVLTVPITAELGGVSPIIVVPGEWTDADLRYHAAHVTTMRLQNAGNNCIAGQVVIVSDDWPQKDAFLSALRDTYASAPQRPNWYPGVERALETARADYPDAQWFDNGARALVEVAPGGDAGPLETTEYFAPVLGVVGLAGTGQDFVDAAVAHANDRLAGSLGANVLIDPDTRASLGTGFDRAIADLRYGTVAINAWTAFGFLTPTATWGAYPGDTIENVHSGIGVVHNALLLDDVERTVVRGPFRPFPRSLSALRGPGTFSLLPTPPWFVTSRTGTAVSRGLTEFRIHRNVWKLAGTLVQAFRA